MSGLKRKADLNNNTALYADNPEVTEGIIQTFALALAIVTTDDAEAESIVSEMGFTNVTKVTH